MYLSIAPELFLLLLPLIIWEAVWKSIGLWKSARNSQLAWFVAIILFNTVGILPIAYILFFQKRLTDSTNIKLITKKAGKVKKIDKAR